MGLTMDRTTVSASCKWVTLFLWHLFSNSFLARIDIVYRLKIVLIRRSMAHSVPLFLDIAWYIWICLLDMNSYESVDI